MTPSSLHLPGARLLMALCCLIVIASATACSIATIKRTVTPVPTTQGFVCPAGAYCAAIPGPVCDAGGASWIDTGVSTRCGASSLLSDVSPKVPAIIGFTPPQQQYATMYTTEITVDFSQSPNALAGFTRVSKSGVFNADIWYNGNWYLQALTTGGTDQVLDSGSVPAATSYQISVTFDGAAAKLSINGAQVGSTSHSPVTSTTQLAILLANTGTSTQTVGLRDFVYVTS